MDLLSLRYFQTVARLEHMTKAAETLQIAQPALSRMIGQLEQELSVRLFDRSGRSIRLNEYGRRFLAKVDQALRTLEEGRQELLDLSARPAGTVVLYLQVGSYLIPDIISEFRSRYPEVEFRLLQNDAEPAAAPPFDLCLSSPPFRLPGMESLPVLKEPIVLAVPCEHPLAERGSVRLRELKDERFIGLKAGKRLRETTDALCREAGFAPRMAYECDEPAMVRGLVRAGLGVSFIPLLTWGGSQGPAVALLNIEEPDCSRAIELSWSPDRYMTLAARTFKDFVLDYFRRLGSVASESE